MLPAIDSMIHPESNFKSTTVKPVSLEPVIVLNATSSATNSCRSRKF